MTLRAYARHRGCTHRAVQVALRDGRIVLDSDGRIDSAKADRMWAANTRHRNGNGHDEALSRDMAKARTANEMLSAKLRELDYRERAGELVEVAEVERVAFASARKIRDLLLAVGSRVGPAIAMQDALTCEDAIDAEMRRICDELARPPILAGQREQPDAERAE